MKMLLVQGMNRESLKYYDLAQRLWDLTDGGRNDYWGRHFTRLTDLMKVHQVYPFNPS